MLRTMSGSYPSSAMVWASSRMAPPNRSYVRFSRTWDMLTPSHLGPMEVEEGPGGGRPALALVTRPVPVAAVRELGRRAEPEHAQLPDLHARPELDRER